MFAMEPHFCYNEWMPLVDKDKLYIHAYYHGFQNWPSPFANTPEGQLIINHAWADGYNDRLTYDSPSFLRKLMEIENVLYDIFGQEEADEIIQGSRT